MTISPAGASFAVSSALGGAAADDSGALLTAPREDALRGRLNTVNSEKNSRRLLHASDVRRPALPLRKPRRGTQPRRMSHR
jgi:hypothetical protein